MIENKDKLAVIEKAKVLFDRTLTLTSNRKKFPAKFRIFVERIQNTSMDIYENLTDANRMNLSVPEERNNRMKLQRKVIGNCDKLNFYIEIAQNHKLISVESCDSWSGLCCDVKYMTIAWKNKDKDR